MIENILAGAKVELEHKAHRLAFTTGGTVFVFVGVGFMTAAGWIVLYEMRDAVFASMVCAAIYISVGLILFGVSKRSYKKRDLRAAGVAGAAAAASNPYAAAASVAQAFLIGLGSGLQTRGNNKKR